MTFLPGIIKKIRTIHYWDSIELAKKLSLGQVSQTTKLIYLLFVAAIFLFICSSSDLI